MKADKAKTLYRCKTSYFTSKKENLGLFENGELRKIFGTRGMK
jgi:hypothetical protein